MDLIARVHADIRDLIPGFLRNRTAELASLRRAIEEQSVQKLERLACRMYGAGNPFGFRQVTTFGKQLRGACEVADFREASRILDEYERYLGEVAIEYVDAPPKRKEWLPRIVERRQEISAIPMASAKRSIDRRVGERRKSGLRQPTRSLRAG